MQKQHLFKNLSQEQTLLHKVTQKNITSPFSFSLALHTQETKEEIIKNRENIEKEFPKMHFIVANQTHSANIKIITEEKNIGWKQEETAIRECDALITQEKNIMLTILTADCVPILIFDPIQQVIAVVHAGWKGTEQKILLKTIQKMQSHFQSESKNIIVGIAPAIGKCCYEVDWNVAKYFKNIKNSYSSKNNKYMLNLPYINKLQLLQAGLKEENIEMSNICTACQVDSYFSYRKEQGCSGRFMSMIGLKSITQ